MTLMTTRLARLGGAAAIALAGATVVPAAATASASETGCPGGMFTFTVEELLPHGYTAEFLARVDLNQDGVVCARPLSAQQQEKYCATHGCSVLIIMAFDDNRRGPDY